MFIVDYQDGMTYRAILGSRSTQTLSSVCQHILECAASDGDVDDAAKGLRLGKVVVKHDETLGADEDRSRGITSEWMRGRLVILLPETVPLTQ